MEALGVSAFDPTSGAARDFNDVVNDLSAAMSDLTDQERTQYGQLIFGIQGFDAYNKMVVTSTEKQEAWADALAKSSGEAARQYETMTDNLLGDIDKLGSAFEGLQIVISDALTPTVREFAQFGAEAMNALREGFQGGGVSGFMSALSDIVTDGVKMLAEKAPEFASVSLQFIEALATGILNNRFLLLQTAYEIIDNTITGLDTWLSTNSSELVKAGFNIVDTISHGFSEAGELISNYIGDFVPVIADAFLSYHDALFTVGMAGQPVRYVFSDIANTSNVMLTSFYWRDTLPAEVRLNSVVTGTYNFPGTYKIVYRVNGGEYRTLADNLSTSKSYTLAASATALGLASNERVTEIMFVFGQAPAGFAQVEKPMLYCTAISSITTTSFVNVADVGGVYNGVWVQAVSRWVTTVYGKITTLPKTGY